MRYPKIQSLYNRDLETFKVKSDELRREEYRLIKEWYVTEKVDGMNIRVMLSPTGVVSFGGRTDRAVLHKDLLAHLNETFPADLMRGVFTVGENGLWPEVTIFGEGYGPGIQKGGGYRGDKAFILFDININTDWWMNWASVVELAEALDVPTVPLLDVCYHIPKTKTQLAAFFLNGSEVARRNGKGYLQAEGVIAKTEPLLFDRRGKRVIWKLKFRDF